jgi:hypothetical protein
MMKTVPPLHIPGFTVRGPTGERDNVQRLSTVVSAVLPPGTVAVVDVVHGAGCPCASGTHPFLACTCTAVDVTVRAVNVRAS